MKVTSCRRRAASTSSRRWAVSTGSVWRRSCCRCPMKMRKRRSDSCWSCSGLNERFVVWMYKYVDMKDSGTPRGQQGASSPLASTSSSSGSLTVPAKHTENFLRLFQVLQTAALHTKHVHHRLTGLHGDGDTAITAQQDGAPPETNTVNRWEQRTDEETTSC